MADFSLCLCVVCPSAYWDTNWIRPPIEPHSRSHLQIVTFWDKSGLLYVNLERNTIQPITTSSRPRPPAWKEPTPLTPPPRRLPNTLPLLTQSSHRTPLRCKFLRDSFLKPYNPNHNRAMGLTALTVRKVCVLHTTYMATWPGESCCSPTARRTMEF